MKKDSKKEWMKNIARDFIALGGIPLFLLILVRVYLLNKPGYFSQFIIAGVIFLILTYLLKTSMYSGLGLVALVFTMLYYNNIQYSIFAVIAYLLLVGSLFYLKEDKKKTLLGVLLGAIATGISYYAVRLFF